jgi:hypothetical protein
LYPCLKETICRFGWEVGREPHKTLLGADLDLQVKKHINILRRGRGVKGRYFLALKAGPIVN